MYVLGLSRHIPQRLLLKVYLRDSAVRIFLQGHAVPPVQFFWEGITCTGENKSQIYVLSTDHLLHFRRAVSYFLEGITGSPRVFITFTSRYVLSGRPGGVFSLACGTSPTCCHRTDADRPGVEWTERYNLNKKIKRLEVRTIGAFDRHWPNSPSCFGKLLIFFVAEKIVLAY